MCSGSFFDEIFMCLQTLFRRPVRGARYAVIDPAARLQTDPTVN
jgi:hypothetical protein